MRRFAELYWRLDATTGVNEKLAALRDYFSAAPPEDAVCALHVLSGGRQSRAVPTTLLRRWAAEEAGIPDWLLEECYAQVGDLAETLALVLPPTADETGGMGIGLAECLATTIHPLRGASDEERRGIVRAAWRTLATRERIVWHKLLTGGCRVGVSRTLVARALAEVAGIEPALMAHRLTGPPITTAEEFCRLLRNEPTEADARRPYPFCLATALDPEAGEDETGGSAARLGAVSDWQAEWKWDGMRAQLVRRGDGITIWSRGEELVNDSFPEIVQAAATLPDSAVLDGELIAVRDGRLLGFAALSRRSGRRTVTRKLLADVPCVFVAYDLLELAGEDMRRLPLVERRSRLERIVAQPFDPLPDQLPNPAAAEPPPLPLFAPAEAAAGPAVLCLSPIVEADSWESLAAIRGTSRQRGVEGLMLKRRASPYGTGRARGDWWKWKIEPLEIDAVLLAAQAGHGRRAGLHTDYTLGVWHEGRLVTVAKAYSGLSDAEIVEVDRIVRSTTRERHGPVRVVEPTLVFQLAFEGVARSTRHKAGLAVRFPRIARWRRDKEPADAAALGDLRRMIEEPAAREGRP
jgi:DNA ligase-1